MKRRHHNTKGLRQIKRGKTHRQVECIARRLGIPMKKTRETTQFSEIGEAFQLTSLATVHQHITNIAEKGYIRRAWNRSRSIEIVAQTTGHCPTCGRPIHQADDTIAQ